MSIEYWRLAFRLELSDVGCNMYGHDSTTFKIKRKRYGGEVK